MWSRHGLPMQVVPKTRHVVEGLVQFGSGLGLRHAAAIAQLRQPADQLGIAQAARRLLDIGLQMIKGIAVLSVALVGEARKIAQQRVAIGGDEARQLFGEGGVEGAISGQKPLVEQADIQLGVLIVDFGAFGGRTHGLADAQAGIPQVLQKSGDDLLLFGGQAGGRVEQQQIDIGEGEQMTAPIAAHGNDGSARGDAGKQDLRGGLRYRQVDLSGTLRQGGDGISRGEKGLVSRSSGARGPILHDHRSGSEWLRPLRRRKFCRRRSCPSGPRWRASGVPHRSGRTGPPFPPSP